MTVSAIATGVNMKPIEAGSLRLGSEGRRARTELLDAIRYLQEKGVNGAAANASVLLPDSPGHVLVTSRGLPTDITEDDFGVVALDGAFVGGRLGGGIRAVIAMHTHAYKRPGVTAAIHTHSPNATAFALAQKPIPVHYEPLITRGQSVEVPVTSYGERNSGAMVGKLDNLLAQNSKTRAVLLANHGLLVFHESPKKTADLVVIIEEAAGMIIRASLIGGSKPIFT